MPLHHLGVTDLHGLLCAVLVVFDGRWQLVYTGTSSTMPAPPPPSTQAFVDVLATFNRLMAGRARSARVLLHDWHRPPSPAADPLDAAACVRLAAEVVRFMRGELRGALFFPAALRRERACLLRVLPGLERALVDLLARAEVFRTEDGHLILLPEGSARLTWSLS